jgi:chromosomal replication initiation ATPase DnaA
MKATQKNPHFDRLVSIVGEVYGVEPSLILSKIELREITTPRRIVAAIWARGDTYNSTCRLVGYVSNSAVANAISRFRELIKEPAHAYRIRKIMDRCKDELPWLVVD